MGGGTSPHPGTIPRSLSLSNAINSLGMLSVLLDRHLSSKKS